MVLRVNVFESEPECDDSDPEGYRSALLRIGRDLGSDELGLNLFEVPPGESVCPYHYEYVEEWLLILEGSATLRVPEGEEEVKRGDLVRFPAGPDGAHKVVNQGSEPVRLLMFSSSHEPAVAVYPDSGKVGVWTPNPEDKWMLRREDGGVGYFEGEV